MEGWPSLRLVCAFWFPDRATEPGQRKQADITATPGYWVPERKRPKAVAHESAGTQGQRIELHAHACFFCSWALSFDGCVFDLIPDLLVCHGLDLGVSVPSSPSRRRGPNICKEFELSTEDTRIHARAELGILPIDLRAFKGRPGLLLFARLAASLTFVPCMGRPGACICAAHRNQTHGIPCQPSSLAINVIV